MAEAGDEMPPHVPSGHQTTAQRIPAIALDRFWAMTDDGVESLVLWLLKAEDGTVVAQFCTTEELAQAVGETLRTV